MECSIRGGNRLNWLGFSIDSSSSYSRFLRVLIASEMVESDELLIGDRNRSNGLDLLCVLVVAERVDLDELLIGEGNFLNFVKKKKKEKEKKKKGLLFTHSESAGWIMNGIFNL